MSEHEITVKNQEDNLLKAEAVRDDRKVFTPPVDIWENEEGFLLVSNMPGVTKDNVTIDYEEGELKIYGQISGTSDTSKLLLNEYSIGDYSRVFRIPDGIDAEKISAQIKDGVLKVTLPKQEKLKLRKIEIQ
jgi:HSP20 family molecular chaperone IbpA